MKAGRLFRRPAGPPAADHAIAAPFRQGLLAEAPCQAARRREDGGLPAV